MSAELVFIGGDIVTLDPEKPRAQALAVHDGRIVFVGSDADAASVIGPNSRVVKLAGGSVTPGLVDSHAHLVGLGAALENVNLRNAVSAEAAAKVASEFGQKLPSGEWVSGRGWDQNRWQPAVFPDRKVLDAVVADRPVALRRVDGHAVWVNSKALALAKITRETKDPAGGRIVRDRLGEPTGVLIDSAMGLVTEQMESPSDEVLRRRIVKGARAAVERGLTAVHDMGLSAREVAVYQALADQEQLPLRVYGMLSGSRAVVEGLERRVHDIDRDGRGFFIVRGVKVYADGALGSRGAALRQPYADDPGNRGLWVTSPEELRNLAELIAAAGWQMATHAIGDDANRAVLDAYEAGYAKHPGQDLRFRIEHAQVLAPEDIARMGKLKVIASMQPTHCTSDMPWAVARLGPERAAGAYAWRQLLKSGTRIAFGSDFPVEEVAPLLGLYAAVTRQDAQGQPPGGFFPAEKLTLDEAIRAFSFEGAYASFTESFRGVLRAGAIADLTVYDRRLKGDASLLSTQIRMTVVDGKVVFERE